MMKDRLAIIDGIRTPFAKAGGPLRPLTADRLGSIVVRELLYRLPLPASQLDHVIIGNVAQPAHAANIARVIALQSGISTEVPAYTVHRNCASGMESLTTAAMSIFSGQSEIVLAGGTESMSNIPLLFSPKMTAFFESLMTCRTPLQQLCQLFKFRPSFLKPVIGVMQGLTDPVCELVMGLTAENIANDFQISRSDQDQFALQSHQRAVQAEKAHFFNAERMVLPAIFSRMSAIMTDHGPRESQSLDALSKLKPYFDRKNGTVTVGNACPLTDGAAAMVVMAESKARQLGLTPLGYISGFAYAGLDPSRMGLGPVYAMHKVFQKTGFKLADMDLIEINEAFASQVLGCIQACDDVHYCKQHLNADRLGEIDMDRLNINGGAIALGHPVGTSGTRLILTLLHALRRIGKQRGVASLCIGGGQGGACIVEVT
jgi:acetyl-CoA C-acetyltransferase/acetyl-CoA acyltransferase